MEINVKQFIYDNYTEYLGDDSFLSPISEKTQKVWNRCKELLKQEKENDGVLDIELNTLSGVNNFAPGYIDKKNEVIVGLQTDAPLKRILNPYGGIRMMEKCLSAYDYELPKETKDSLKAIKRTHNDGVFDAYTDEIKKARHSGLITGLPDTYGRGRIIGDYRRVPLYGLTYLINQKEEDFNNCKDFQLREEISMQIRALRDMGLMAASYSINIWVPATTAQEAVQALYMAYLAGAKENNGAATSLGRVSTFLDIYIENDIKNGILTEAEAQELIDQFVIKLRLIRHLRTPEYDELFAGDPTWVTEAIGGMAPNGKSLVTKTSFRFLHTLENLGAAPEPNLTVLWDENLPQGFKEYCAKISITTSAIQYENDHLMRDVYGEDYGIACCVSGMRLGEQMQFFGARCNLAKALLYAINEGRDENSGEVIVPNIPKLSNQEYLEYDEVIKNYDKVLEYVADLYVQANNIIHYMHDKYAYEASQMALHNSNVEHLMAFGVAGFSVATDSLSAIKYGKVKAIRNKDNLTIEFINEEDFPKFGNDDIQVDSIGMALVTAFSNQLKKYKLHKNAKATLSILTITSNIVYGKKTGATPDGRKAKEPFAPGANPMHGRDINGALAALNSVSKIPYKHVCEDGISNTFTITPSGLGNTFEIQKNNLVAVLDGYFEKGHHLNINVLNKDTLIDALNHPENYSTLTIRVSGYAVLFNSLTIEQKHEIINRTFHGGVL